MRRLLLTVAVLTAVGFVHVGAARASEADAERRCVADEEPASLLSEARLATVLQAIASGSFDARCVALRGDRADCEWHGSGVPSGPAGAWTPWARDHWLPPRAVAQRRSTSRFRWCAEHRLVVCDGFARELERPPRG